MTITQETIIAFRIPEEIEQADEFEKTCADVYKKDITTQYVYFTITHSYFTEQED